MSRYIRSGEALLDQAEGVRKQLAALPETAGPRPLAAFAIEEAWARDFRRWYESVGRGLYRYLHDQFLDVLPILANGLPPDTGKPRHHIGVDNGEEWLGVTVDELKTFQNALGVKRSVAAVAPTAARFEELHASGLVDEDVIVDHVKEMVAPRTPRQLANAIAAAKELTEATLRAALDRLDQTYSHRDGLPMLMTRWRDAVRALAPPGPEGAPSLDAALAAIGDLCRSSRDGGMSTVAGTAAPRILPVLRLAMRGSLQTPPRRAFVSS